MTGTPGAPDCGALAPHHVAPHPLSFFQISGCDNTKHHHIPEPEAFRKTSDPSAQRRTPSDVISAQSPREQKQRLEMSRRLEDSAAKARGLGVI